MKTQEHQKKLVAEGRALNFGDHSPKAESERVKADNPGHHTATRRWTDVTPAEQKALHQSKIQR